MRLLLNAIEIFLQPLKIVSFGGEAKKLWLYTTLLLLDF